MIKNYLIMHYLKNHQIVMLIKIDVITVSRSTCNDKGQICIEFNPIYLVFCVVYHLFWMF